jgi:hypothetical protein
MNPTVKITESNETIGIKAFRFEDGVLSMKQLELKHFVLKMVF